MKKNKIREDREMIIDKMNTLENLTNQEKAVVDYIIANPKALLEMSVNELANASYTSASTITRLCKKLGTKGYADMKFIYVSEYPEMMKLKDSLKVVPFSRNSGIDDIIHTMPLIYSRAIDYTRSMLNRNTVIRVSNLMKRAQVIDLYGDGINFEIARNICYKLDEIGISANAYNSIQWNHCKRLQQDKIPSFSILLSHTGKNPSMVDAAKRLKQYNIPSLSITGNVDKRLLNLTDYNFQIMITENTFEFSTVIFTMSSLYILDILVASLIVHNYDKIERHLEELIGQRYDWQND